MSVQLGGLSGELHRLWRTRDPIGYHAEYGYSCMGYEIAGGLGVKMAHPDREVYVLVGDGSYLMLHTELLTARQMGLKINVVVVNNRGFGCINRLQQGCGSPRYGNLILPRSQHSVSGLCAERRKLRRPCTEGGELAAAGSDTENPMCDLSFT